MTSIPRLILRRASTGNPVSTAASHFLPLTAVCGLLLLVGCGDDDNGPVDVADTGDTSDTTPDGSDAPDADTDVPSDVPDTTPDVEEVSPDVPDVDPDGSDGPDTSGPCGALIECIDERTGNPSIAVCRTAGLPTGTVCARQDDTACCIPPFRCETNQDCEDNREAEGFCLDPRFPCQCEVTAGLCFTQICSASAECDAGELCSDGRCVDAPEAAGYVARILTPNSWLAAGSSLQLEAVAVRADNPTQTAPNLAINWEVLDASTFGTVSASGLATADATLTGAFTIRATVAGNEGDPGDTVELSNLGADFDSENNVRVYVVDEATRLPVSGATIHFVPTEGEIETVETETEGVADFERSSTFSVHVFADGYAYVSMVSLDQFTVLVPLAPNSRARIDEIRDGFVCDPERPGVVQESENCGGVSQPVCLCYELTGIDIARGTPDFTNATGSGEVDVSISGFSLGNTLLDLNFDLIVGPQIERIIPPNPVINLDDPVDLPSGVTLDLNGQPFVDSFIVTAPAGNRTVWSVGGRVPLGDTLRALLPSLGGNLEFGPIIAALLPLFNDFYSGVSAPIQLNSTPTFPVRDPGMVLNVPTQRRVAITAPQLPQIDTGFSDTAIFLGGVMLPGEGFVPLGISGGTDVVGRAVADGFIDGVQNTPEIDPVNLSMATMHGSIDTPGTRYAFASVALLLGSSLPNAPREATSAIITTLPVGAPLPSALPYGDQEFPPLATGSSWANDEGQRLLTVTNPSDTFDLYRIAFQGEGDRLWVVYAPGNQGTIVLPTPPGDAFEDRLARGRVSVVGVVLEGDSVDYGALAGANGRSFVDLFSVLRGFSIIGL